MEIKCEGQYKTATVYGRPALSSFCRHINPLSIHRERERDEERQAIEMPIECGFEQTTPHSSREREGELGEKRPLFRPTNKNHFVYLCCFGLKKTCTFIFRLAFILCALSLL